MAKHKYNTSVRKNIHGNITVLKKVAVLNLYHDKYFSTT